jgi:hypothetical protein
VVEQFHLGDLELGSDARVADRRVVGEMGGERLVDVEDLLAALRMGAHDRVDRGREQVAVRLALFGCHARPERRHQVVHSLEWSRNTRTL